ncbi:MAG: hypothetical protein EXS39_07240 [Opitutaceae bacterium]|nr:hypothetical protein [Opitutaceae bacterium]
MHNILTKRFLALVCIISPLCNAEPAATIGSSALAVREKYLLLDSRVVERVENAVLRVGTVAKHPGGPLFSVELPWEQNMGHMYSSVLFDEADQLYKVWYYTLSSPVLVGQTNWIRDITPGTLAPDPLGEPVANRTGVKWRLMKETRPSNCSLLYAVSKDGIRWEKPALDVYRYKGKPTNIVILNTSGAGVFKDVRDPDPSRRYKVINRNGDIGQVYVAFSPDGINWSDPVDTKVTAAADTHNNAFWAPELQRYVGITRGWSKGAMGWKLPEALPWKTLVGGVRTVVRIESEDFIHWTQPVEVLRGPDKAQTYSMPVFRCADIYLGLPAIYRENVDKRVQTELAWSPDTKAWNRIDEGAALVPFSEIKGSPDWGCVYASATPIVLKDEIRIYYAGERAAHSTWDLSYLCLATLRPDGWAGYVPKDESRPAVVLTQPLVCSGTTLQLTADVSPGGSVKATVLDAAGDILAEGRPVATTVTDGIVADVAKYQGRWVRVRLELRTAKVYALAFRL